MRHVPAEKARSTAEPNPKSVFVVHGRNQAVRDSMFTFLRDAGLEPIEWDEAIALTNNASPYIGQVLDAALTAAQAIVVLMTPDEIAYLQPQHGHGEHDPETQAQPQARPNVLFEAGMALARHPERTILVEVGEMRPFSDVAGRHAVRLTNDITRRTTLMNRLMTAGCAVDPSKTEWHTSGDFSPPHSVGDGLPLGRRVPGTARVTQPIDIHLRYINQGGTKIDKLQVTNRGTETAYDVVLEFPENAALQPTGTEPIRKIPGNGQTVTVGVINHSRMVMGSTGQDAAFDVHVIARTEDGQSITKEIFIDTNT